MEKINSVLIVGCRVSVEKILTESWESPMHFSGGILKTIDEDKVRVVTNSKTVRHTHNFSGGGLFYLSKFKVTADAVEK